MIVIEAAHMALDLLNFSLNVVRSVNRGSVKNTPFPIGGLLLLSICYAAAPNLSIIQNHATLPSTVILGCQSPHSPHLAFKERIFGTADM